MDIEKVSVTEYFKLKQSLVAALAEQLEEEVSMGNDLDSELDETMEVFSNMPTVDSKTVMKLNPKFKKVTGYDIQTDWIRSGGYETVDEAIKDVISNFEAYLKKESGNKDE